MSEPTLILSTSSITTKRPRKSHSTPPEVRMFRRAVRNGDCLEIPGKPSMYPNLWTGKKGQGGRSRRASHIAWETAHSVSVPDGLFVLHHCDNRRCVEAKHLYVGTKADNSRDMAIRDRSGRRRHPESWTQKSYDRVTFAKLDWTAVDKIRERYTEGNVPYRVLAKEFRVTSDTIGRIVRGNTWPEEGRP